MFRFFKLLIISSTLCICWCMAESFLVQEKPERRRTPQQVRQEIAEVMGDILELESVYVATKGHIQQELCKHIRSVAENDKESILKKASLQDLQKSLKMLKEEKVRYEKEIALDKKFLSSLRSNMQC